MTWFSEIISRLKDSGAVLEGGGSGLAELSSQSQENRNIENSNCPFA